MEENEKRKLSKKKPTHNLPQGHLGLMHGKSYMKMASSSS
ncbi:hypothetical protein ERO13_A01G035801v2 [Gossypium hirsutum]|uniref:Uncharacterized protein n=1 Tax=Gossypium darwinii TaxID=34276 RepID=A0A5D2HJB3_GOSDA|nr:hypothetical protein ERO13_A01G035801v2 [Gossypium hirsutum]TYH29699.1 hypothetical protein ES288_A01G033400v1 [Gossypium darwinii]